MKLPLLGAGEQLPAPHTPTLLGLVQSEEAFSAEQCRLHLCLEPTLVVLLPLRVVRIRLVLDQHVTLDPDLGCPHQPYCVRLAFACQRLATEDPGSASWLRVGVVAAFHPASRSAPVSSARPAPQGTVDLMIDVGEGACARCVPVVQGPPPDLRCQHLDQFPGAQRAAGPPDHLP